MGGMLGSAVLKDGNPFNLHYVMFIPALMGQGTVEQQGYWVSRAWKLDIIGTYAQVIALIDKKNSFKKKLFLKKVLNF